MQTFPAAAAAALLRPSRRQVLLGGAALAGTQLFAPSIARAQSRELNFWTTQRGPTQAEAYKEIWEGFTRETGYRVVVQTMTEEEYLPRLSASLAADLAPDLMSHMPPEFAIELHGQGLLAPMDAVVKAVGEEDFYENSRELLFDAEKGIYPAISVVNSSTTGPLWYRTDLLKAAGLAPPTTQADYLAIAAATTGRGIFGNVYPFGKTSMGDKLFVQTIWQSGGTIFNPDLTIAFDSDAVVKALEFIREAVRYSPPASATYAYSETINAFIQGRVAMAPYSGRVLSNMISTSPQLAESFAVTAFPGIPAAEGGREVYVGDFQSLAIPAASKDKAVSELMAQWLFKPENYLRFLLAVPGHNLPNLRSIAESEGYKSDPLLNRFATASQTLIDTTVKSRSLLKETTEHKLNPAAGRIYNSRVLVETIHDVIIGGTDPKKAAGACVDKLTALLG